MMMGQRNDAGMLLQSEHSEVFGRRAGATREYGTLPVYRTRAQVHLSPPRATSRTSSAYLFRWLLALSV